jgi:hypothetical protein
VRESARRLTWGTSALRAAGPCGDETPARRGRRSSPSLSPRSRRTAPGTPGAVLLRYGCRATSRKGGAFALPLAPALGGGLGGCPDRAGMPRGRGAFAGEPTPGLEPGTPTLPQFRVATRTASERTVLRGPGGGSSSPGRQRAFDAGRDRLWLPWNGLGLRIKDGYGVRACI